MGCSQSHPPSRTCPSAGPLDVPCIQSSLPRITPSWFAQVTKWSRTRGWRTMSSFTQEREFFYVCFFSVHVVFTMETWQGLCRGFSSGVAPTEASRGCQWILNGSNQEPHMSIMEKPQSSATWAPQKKFRTHLWSRKASCDSFLSQYLAMTQPGLFCHSFQLPVQISSLTMGRLCRFRFHFHQWGKWNTMGAVQSWEQDMFSLEFPGPRMWKMSEPKQTWKPIQILCCSFSVASGCAYYVWVSDYSSSACEVNQITVLLVYKRQVFIWLTQG